MSGVKMTESHVRAVRRAAKSAGQEGLPEKAHLAREAAGFIAAHLRQSASPDYATELANTIRAKVLVMANDLLTVRHDPDAIRETAVRLREVALFGHHYGLAPTPPSGLPVDASRVQAASTADPEQDSRRQRSP